MRRITGRSSAIPFPQIWQVPPRLRGTACVLCGHFFQDGETHGELDITTGALTCKSRVLRIGNRPSLALVKQ